MGSFLKKTAFRLLGMKKYLQLMQSGYFFAYNTGILKSSPSYDCHYFVRKLIRKGDVVIDIGANLGYYSKLFSKWVGDTGKVYSVEPIKIYNDVFLKATKKCKNIILLPYALGTEEGKITLVSSPKTGYLSTGLPHVYDPEKDGPLENQEFVFEAEMKVPAKLFENLERIDYIKCDIEGFEHVVISNMQKLIEKHKPVVQVELWEDNKPYIFGIFESMGYTPYRVQRKTDTLSSSAKIIDEGYGDFIFIHDNDKKEHSRNIS